MEPSGEKILAELLISFAKDLGFQAKEKIKTFWLKQEYGITLSPEEGELINKVSKENELYKIFKKYLGDHWSLKLIKVGLYISELNEDGKKLRAESIQKEVRKKYDRKGLKIIQIASTGILEPVMQHIIDLKLLKGANYIVLCKEFDKILSEWDIISIPVARSSLETDIRQSITSKVQIGNPIFFVYGAGRAAVIAQLILAKMSNENIFLNKYLMSLKSKHIINVEYCLWVFEKIDSPETEVFN